MNYSNWENPTNMTRNEIVFAGRNKDYGAYVIRRNYEKLVIKSMMTTITIIGLIFTMPYIYSRFKTDEIKKIVVDKIVEVDLTGMDFKMPDPVTQPKQSSSSKGSPAGEYVATDSVSKEPDEQLGQDILGEDKDTMEVAVITPGTGGMKVDSVVDTKPLVLVEDMPVFPGGEAELIRFLSDNINYPYKAREANIKGTVYIKFVVNKDGSISATELIRGIGSGCDEEALRVVKKMPRWTPGYQNHQPVAVQFMLPITFKIR